MNRKIIKKEKSGNGFRYLMECLECQTHFSIRGGVYNAGHGAYCKNSCSYKAQCRNKKHPRWKGGKIMRSGYCYINKPNHPFSGKQGYIAEHRLVMEKHIRRFLKQGEVVHHKNHVKTDNRLENLVLCESPGQHTLLHHPEVMEKLHQANKR